MCPSAHKKTHKEEAKHGSGLPRPLGSSPTARLALSCGGAKGAEGARERALEQLDGWASELAGEAPFVLPAHLDGHVGAVRHDLGGPLPETRAI